MQVLGKDIQPLGMGCWPIGGKMYWGENSVGYANSNDAESIKTIHAALDSGIRLFDTAAAYGAGHSERLLGNELKGRDDVIIVTKIAIGIDEANRQLTGIETDPATVVPAIDACRSRLQRDCIDVVLLHPNELTIEQAKIMLDALETARQDGKVASYGWSTDITEKLAATLDWPGFSAVEHCMNVLFDAPNIQQLAHDKQLVTLLRSPLAMGLLSGKYGAGSTVEANDVRGGQMGADAEYFKNCQPNPEYVRRIEAVKEILTSDGRTLYQGALCWLWGKNAHNIPIPGARTVEQIEGLAGALSFGALSTDAMAQIETLIDRQPEDSADQIR